MVNLSTGSWMKSAVRFYKKNGYELYKIFVMASKRELSFFRKPVTSNNGKWVFQPFEN